MSPRNAEFLTFDGQTNSGDCCEGRDGRYLQ